MPGKWFGSAACVQRDKNTVYIVSQSADQNHFRAVVDGSISIMCNNGIIIRFFNSSYVVKV